METNEGLHFKDKKRGRASGINKRGNKKAEIHKEAERLAENHKLRQKKKKQQTVLSLSPASWEGEVEPQIPLQGKTDSQF
jgi:hypothetical protein